MLNLIITTLQHEYRILATKTICKSVERVINQRIGVQSPQSAQSPTNKILNENYDILLKLVIIGGTDMHSQIRVSEKPIFSQDTQTMSSRRSQNRPSESSSPPERWKSMIRRSRCKFGIQPARKGFDPSPKPTTKVPLELSSSST